MTPVVVSSVTPLIWPILSEYHVGFVFNFPFIAENKHISSSEVGLFSTEISFSAFTPK